MRKLFFLVISALLLTGCDEFDKARAYLLESAFYRNSVQKIIETNEITPFQNGDELWIGKVAEHSEAGIRFEMAECLESKPRNIIRSRCGMDKFDWPTDFKPYLSPGDIVVFVVSHDLKARHHIHPERSAKLLKSNEQWRVFPLGSPSGGIPIRFSPFRESSGFIATHPSTIARRDELQTAFDEAGIVGHWKIGDLGSMIFYEKCRDVDLYIPRLFQDGMVKVPVPDQNGFIFSLSAPHKGAAHIPGNDFSHTNFYDWQIATGLRYLHLGDAESRVWHTWDFEFSNSLLNYREILTHILETLKKCPPWTVPSLPPLRDEAIIDIAKGAISEKMNYNPNGKIVIEHTDTEYIVTFPLPPFPPGTCHGDYAAKVFIDRQSLQVKSILASP